MTDREKLIALLKAGHEAFYKIFDPHMDYFGALADHILANGVTFAADTNDGGKWISVEDRLPDRNDQIIAFYETMRDTQAAIQIHKAWAMTESCTHWMPLPEPPKED